MGKASTPRLPLVPERSDLTASVQIDEPMSDHTPTEHAWYDEDGRLLVVATMTDEHAKIVSEWLEAARLVSADEPLWFLDISKHPHFGNPWVLDELEDWKRWGVLREAGK